MLNIFTPEDLISEESIINFSLIKGFESKLQKDINISKILFDLKIKRVFNQ